MVLNRYKLDGKVALVTGVGRGLGRTMALSLAQAGADVVISARTPTEIDEIAQAVQAMGRRCLAVTADVTNARAVAELVERALVQLGTIDILVNNAGGEFGVSKPATEITDDEWLLVLNTNLTGAFYCTRAVGRHMLERRQGRVINVGCLYGIRGSVGHAAYAAAKGGVLQMTRALALEWASQGVTVNAIGIGWFEGQTRPQPPEMIEHLRRAIPARRFGMATDIETVLIYLASDASRYLTGQTIWLDGGILCR
jgi:NAD(P)-dependent dehydrogenase (short-subunit alcohol dehydrogenase family)